MTCKNCGGAWTPPKGQSLTVCPFCQTDNSTQPEIAASEGEAALRSVFLNQGAEIYKDKLRLSGLLADIFAAEKKLLKILRLAVQENIANKLLEIREHCESEQKMRIAAIVSYFADDYGMDKERAAEAVRVLAFGAGISAEALEGFVEKPRVDVGSIYPFGGYDWRVLDVRNGKALIITEEIIERRAYHHSFVDITWEKCDLRCYLNGLKGDKNDYRGKGFIDRFEPHDKSRIVEDIVENKSNLWKGTVDKNDTKDKIFLLSHEEVCGCTGITYFGNSSTKLINPFGWIDDNNNTNRIAKNRSGKPCWWWLRSISIFNETAHTTACVHIDGTAIPVGPHVSDDGGGVRPALWLNL